MAIRFEDLLPLVEQISAAPGADTRLGALAAMVGLSPTHLQRVFAREIGESPKRLATRIALERAAADLVTTDRSILDIALHSGFESHEGFTRAFRRQFDMAPAHYRERGLSGVHPHTSALVATHREVSRSIAPCIGLYRSSSGARSRSRTKRALETMSYTIEKKTTEATPILFIRRRVAPDQIAGALGEMLPAVFAYATGAGIPLAGPPFARYGEWSPSGVTVDAGLPTATKVDGQGDGDGQVQSGMLRAGPAVSTVHRGPYEKLGEAHRAIEAWLKEHALEPAGAPWEVYLTDPGEVPDPADWLTEVVWPTKE